jgi:hypothetical protein
MGKTEERRVPVEGLIYKYEGRSFCGVPGAYKCAVMESSLEHELVEVEGDWKEDDRSR